MPRPDLETALAAVDFPTRASDLRWALATRPGGDALAAMFEDVNDGTWFYTPREARRAVRASRTQAAD